MKAKTITPTVYKENIFAKYFNQVLQDKPPTLVTHGPYISISRDFGCMANVIAEKLAKEFTRRSKSKGLNHNWRWLNKAILEESSKALELSPSKIEYVFRSKRKTTMDEIVEAMGTRYYKSDKRIRKTITQVIQSICMNGYVIIVGRGGVAFANNNPDSLHFKLTAPIEWRVDHISRNYNKTPAEALRYILKIDQERKYLIDSFMGFDTDHSIFDVVFNRKTMSEDEIISIILNLAESRNMIR